MNKSEGETLMLLAMTCALGSPNTVAGHTAYKKAKEDLLKYIKALESKNTHTSYYLADMTRVEPKDSLYIVATTHNTRATVVANDVLSSHGTREEAENEAQECVQGGKRIVVLECHVVSIHHPALKSFKRRVI